MLRFAVALGALVLLVVGAAQAGPAAGSSASARGPDAARAGEAPDALAARDPGAPVGAEAAAARRDFRARNGAQALLAVDPATGTPRALGRLDGFLTAASGRDASDVALDYVRARPAVFGVDAADLAGLKLVRRYEAGGIEHLTWAQTYQGIQTVDTSLSANLTPDGRLVNVLGAPRHELAVPSVVPRVAAETAYAAAARGLGGRAATVSSREGGAARATDFVGGGSAELVIFEEGGPRLGWRLLVPADSTHVYDAIVDAATGALVRRQNLVEHANAQRYRNYPGAPAGGSAQSANIDAYLDPGATILNGPTARTVADVNDAIGGPSTPIPAGVDIPSSGGNWNYGLTGVPNTYATCSPLPCVWDPWTINSWQVNKNADATQVHWFVGNFHDHLENTAAIAFTNAAGNFEGTDRIVAQSMDGANTGGGFPDDFHFNNANMATYPDGTSGYMQMYLTEASDLRGASTGFDSTVIYHEYGHGLVGRTITDAGGFQAVGGAQGGAINEGTADWYALDYVVGEGLETDAAGIDVYGAKYSFGDFRSEATDCEVDSNAVWCPGAGTAGSGGYTYGDFGRIYSGPEVHADGEIWTQTMWQLRRELIAAHGAADGVDRVRRLYTTGMRLVPDNPSFLDLRNAIVQADTVHALGDGAIVWQVFAERGMGYFASTTDAGDVAPIQDFTLPPAPGAPTGTVSGSVTDAIAGGPRAGVKVAFGGHESGVGPELSGTSNASGHYSIANVPVGTYRLMRARGAGMEEGRKTDVAVSAGTNTHDFALRRNLASPDGGASIASYTGADNTAFGCGPGGLIDGTQGVVWGSSSPSNPSDPGNKQITVQLPVAAQVGTIEIDPSAGCGDDDTASLGPYEIQVSPNNTAWTTVATGTFNASHRHRFNSVALTSKPAGMQYVRLIAKGPQSSSGSGSAFMDVAELKVFAEPPATVPGVPTGVAATAGDVSANVSWTAPASTGGSAITNYVVTPFVGTTVQTATEVGNVTSATITGLTNGTTYTFKVAAKNAVGTGPQSVASNAVTPVAPAPETNVTGPNGTYARPTATFTLGSTPGGATFECRVNGAAWAACTSPHTLATAVPGQYALEFRAANAGVTDATPAVRQLQVVRPFVADFSGIPDGLADPAVWRPASGGWYVRGKTVSWHGRQGDVPIPGHWWDDDPETDRAVWRPENGGWYIEGFSAFYYGQAGDVPVPADWRDSDGDPDPAVWRPSNGGWYVSGLATQYYGQRGDVPVLGDYDSDPDLDLAVFRPSTGGWFVQGSTTVFHGQAGDVPVPADWNGDGKTDIAVFRPSNGTWYVRGISTTAYGLAGDVPVVGQWDPDAEADRAVWRPGNGGWYVEGSVGTLYHGVADDVP
jgi:extracellular elastinolytic metalloproteinase